VWLLAARPEGIRADEVADALGKSVSTAYNVLASLCEERVAEHHPGGVYRITPAFRDLVASGIAAPAPELHDLSDLVGDLLACTHKRSYLGVVRGGELHIVLERGQQGMPKLPGLKPRIADTAHALALGKVALALAPPAVVARYVQSPALRRFTAHTITDADTLRAELAAVRSRGYAVEREEFDDDFCGGARRGPAVFRRHRDLDDAAGVRRRAGDARTHAPRGRSQGPPSARGRRAAAPSRRARERPIPGICRNRRGS
jgi:acetyl-CoA synthetase